MASKPQYGICGLCFKNTQLARGHIIPDWASSLSSKKLEVVSVEPSWKSLHQEKHQKPSGPIAEYMFCSTCDSSLGRGEDTLKQIVHPNSRKPSYVSKVERNIITITDYDKIKIFCSAIGGLLLKAHLAKQDRWNSFGLPSKRYRGILLGIKNESLYRNLSIMIFKMYSLDNYRVKNSTYSIDTFDSSPFDMQANFPFPTVRKGEHKFGLLFGGLFLFINYNVNGNDKDNSQDEILKVPVYPLDIRYLFDDESIIGLNNFTKVLDGPEQVRFIKTLMETPLTARCPCRVFYTDIDGIKRNRLYKDCCYIYWGDSSNRIS